MKSIQANNNPAGFLILEEGAKNLIGRVKDPSAFLDYATDLIDYSSSFMQRKKELVTGDPIFFLTRLVSFVCLPLSKGGEKVVEEVAKGILAMRDTFGAKGMTEGWGDVVAAYGDSMQFGTPYLEVARETLETFSYILDITECVERYEYNEKKWESNLEQLPEESSSLN